MFGGNAKTNFQVIGKNSSAGYMMSPFGDERWDVDDREKMTKVLKKNLTGYEGQPGYENSYQQHQQVYKVNQPAGQGNIKQPYSGYIHQTDTSHGYMPRSEVTREYYTPEVYQKQAYQNQSLPVVQEQQTVPPARILSPQYNKPAEVYTFLTVPMKLNGLTSDTESKKMRNPVSQSTKFEPRSVAPTPSICERCQQGNTSLPSSNTYDFARNWNSSPSVPILIAGQTGYQPFGPDKATPNPFYSTQEPTSYLPLR